MNKNESKSSCLDVRASGRLASWTTFVGSPVEYAARLAARRCVCSFRLVGCSSWVVACFALAYSRRTGLAPTFFVAISDPLDVQIGPGKKHVALRLLE